MAYLDNYKTNIRHIYDLKSQSKALQDSMDKCKATKKEIDADIEKETSILLEAVQKANSNKELDKDNSYASDDLVVSLLHNFSIEYKDESAALKWLEDNHYDTLYKTTVSIDKNKLKTALKKDAVLSEGLKPYTEEKTTEYLVVTSRENTEKLREHIAESKKEK